jgi:hypothetical protein
MATKVTTETKVVFEPSVNSYVANNAAHREAKQVRAYRQRMAKAALYEFQQQQKEQQAGCCAAAKSWCVIS